MHYFPIAKVHDFQYSQMDIVLTLNSGAIVVQLVAFWTLYSSTHPYTLSI